MSVYNVSSCTECNVNGVVDLNKCDIVNCDRISCIYYLINNPDEYKSIILPNIVLNYDRIRDLLLKRYDRIDYKSSENHRRLVELLKVAVTRRDFSFFDKLSNVVYWRLDEEERLQIDLVRRVIS